MDEPSDIEDVSTIKARWASEGFDCTIWHDVPGKNWPPIVHPYDEKVILLEGQVSFVIDGERVDLQPNLEIFVPAGARHTVHNPGPAVNKWAYGYKNQQPASNERQVKA
ncbi:cupin domain-containing protein [Salinisphaera sp.]|uniref:cupin domain-containing protein n=1 Tax=Salinisphaera sp. TaxID=1914330 RepID=UPI002D798CB7|nr:cupin domain-containing protein [Salinisphaera sp.]HET7312935.1 cupin domain-containing protein [Salinisphaera sp.]